MKKYKYNAFMGSLKDLYDFYKHDIETLYQNYRKI